MPQKRRPAAPRQDYLGVEDAAAITGTSPWFWRRKAYDGTIGSVKLGRRLLIPRSELNRYINEGTRPAAAKSATSGAAADEPPVN